MFFHVFPVFVVGFGMDLELVLVCFFRRIPSMVRTFATSQYALLAISGCGQLVYSTLLCCMEFGAFDCMDCSAHCRNRPRCCATCYEAPCYGLKKDLEARM